MRRGTAIISDKVHVEDKAQEIKENENGACWEIMRVFSIQYSGEASQEMTFKHFFF